MNKKTEKLRREVTGGVTQVAGVLSKLRLRNQDPANPGWGDTLCKYRKYARVGSGQGRGQ